MSSWNDTQLTGMSFEEVCSLQTEAYGQGLCGKETEARVEVTRLVLLVHAELHARIVIPTCIMCIVSA